MNFLVSLFKFLLGVRSPEELPWAQDAWKAIQNGGPLSVLENNLSNRFGLDPNQSEARHLGNEQISIYYLKIDDAHNPGESLDISLKGQKRGGMIVRFISGKAVDWHRPSAVRWYEVPNREKYWYVQILETVRNTT